jgi:hypothetical protein
MQANEASADASSTDTSKAIASIAAPNAATITETTAARANAGSTTSFWK